jgi:hypothetical protein
MAAPRQRLKTGAEQRRQQQHHRGAEFFALPAVVSATPIRPIAVSLIRPIAFPLTSTMRPIRFATGLREWLGDLPTGWRR